MSTTVRPAPGPAAIGASPARAGGPWAAMTVPVPFGGATAPAAGPGTAPAARRRGA
ncbi:hypothetical protein ACFWBI_03550 [Streptomyces sp. NPDC059982]|uniref:hypothetical protein n=1 Tax=Streptomyces sp. NPDC059982 TaxID=3347024 RepID=UPI0036A5187E